MKGYASAFWKFYLSFFLLSAFPQENEGPTLEEKERETDSLSVFKILL